MKSSISNSNNEQQKDFWDSLYTDIITSNNDHYLNNLKPSFERSIMFSCFIRGVSQSEVLAYQKILNLQENNYIIVFHIHHDMINKADFNEDEIYHLIKEVTKPYGGICVVGPLFINKVCILISDNHNPADHDYHKESIGIGQAILDRIHQSYGLVAAVGIGDIHKIHSVHSSFKEALSCLTYCHPGEILHIRQANPLILERQHYDETETEKHLFESIRLRKSEAFNYFCIIMEFIKPLNDKAKKDKILEVIVMICHTLRLDNNDLRPLHYMDLIEEMALLKDTELIEWATQRFIYLTGYTKPQTSVDYSNRVVLSTIEYLENHYSEEISLEDVAEQVNISPQYFSKLIKKSTGFNFIDWLSMLRVKKAKELLTSSNLTVKEVCFLVGYKDPNYFSRIFKKKIGLTPSEYVKNQNIINNKN